MGLVHDGSQVEEIRMGVHRVHLPYGNRALYQHILVGDAFAMLVDTGVHDTPATAIAPYLARQRIAPEAIRLAINSHADADHFGGNGQVRQLYPHCLIGAHILDSRWIENPECALRERYGEFEAYGLPLAAEQRARLARMMGLPTPLDLMLSGSEVVRLGENRVWQILHAPGHSPGHLMLWSAGLRAAVICDAVLGEGIPSAEGKLALAPTYRDTAAYLATIAHLEALGAEWLFTSHFPVVRGAEVAHFLQRSRAWVRRAEAAIMQALRAAAPPLGLPDILQRTAASLGEWVDAARTGLEYPLLGGLEYLEQRGAVRREVYASQISWRANGAAKHE